MIWMLEYEFEKYLIDDESIVSKKKAVSTRLSKGRAVENTLGMSLDTIVSSDINMYRALLEINSKMRNQNGAYSNVLRKYYTFKNNKVFPRLKDFEIENRHRL